MDEQKTIKNDSVEAKQTLEQESAVKQVALSPSAPVSLKVTIAEQAGDCTRTNALDLALGNDNQFQPVSINKLCAIEWQAGEDDELLALSLDRLTLLELTKTASGWQLPLPKLREKDRHYAVIVIKSDFNDATRQNLRKQLLRWDFEEKNVGLTDINQWLSAKSLIATPYSHRLQIP